MWLLGPLPDSYSDGGKQHRRWLALSELRKLLTKLGSFLCKATQKKIKHQPKISALAFSQPLCQSELTPTELYTS